MDNTRGCALYAVPFRLSCRPSYAWTQAFVHTWDHPPSYTTRHRPGIASVSGDRIILDGTTIEEVQDVHRDTLVVVINKVNEFIANREAEQRQEAQRKGDRLADHKKKVRDVGGNITFD